MPATKNIRSIIFDFDYTLADSSSGVVECVGYALREMNLAVPSSKVICRTIGSSLSETFRILTGKSDKVQTAEYVRLFTEQADKIILERTVLLDSVKPTIMDLHRRGLKLGIVSTKFRYRIEAFLSRENIRDIFEVIVGGEDVAAHKPDPEGLIFAIYKLKCMSENTLYVGDSTIDAETARLANIPFVAVLTGVTPKEAFDKYKPDAIINTLRSLSGLLG